MKRRRGTVEEDRREERDAPGGVVQASPVERLLELQQGHGNAAVSRMLVARKRRSVADDMEQRADDAESAREQAQLRGPTSEVGKLSVVEDLASAETLRRQLVADRTTWEQVLQWKREGEDERGNDANVVVDEKLRDQNERAIGKLEDYVADVGSQRGTLSDFQWQMGMLERDHERLVAQVAAYGATAQGADTLEIDDAGIIGMRQVASTGIKTKEFRDLVTSQAGGTAGTHHTAAAQWRSKMMQASRSVGPAQGEFREAVHRMRAAAADVAAATARHSAEDKKGEIDAKSTAASGMQDTISLLGDLVGNIAGLTGWWPDEGAKGDTRSASAGLVKTAALIGMKLLDLDPAKKLEIELAGMKDQLAVMTNEARKQELRGHLQRLEGAKEAAFRLGQEFLNAQQVLAEAQDEYRDAMSKTGLAADKARGKADRFEVIGQLLGETDAYVARADAALAMAAHEVRASRDAATGAEAFDISGGKPGVEWHKLVIRYKPGKKVEVSSYTNWVRVKRGGTDVTNQTMEKAIAELTASRKNVAAHADQLRKAFASR